MFLWFVFGWFMRFQPTYAHDYYVVRKYTVTESLAHNNIQTGITNTVKLSKPRIRYYLDLETCEYVKPNQPCEMVVNPVEVSEYEWNRNKIHRMYVNPEEYEERFWR